MADDPQTHAGALAWCAARHRDRDTPVSDCPGPLTTAATVRSEDVGLEPGVIVEVYRCGLCGAELAIGRGATPRIADAAPALHGRLLWIARNAGDDFTYVDPEFGS